MANIVPIEGLGIADVWAENNIEANRIEGRDPNTLGVFSSFSLCTPKYARYRPDRHHEFEGTMARLLLQVPSGTMDQIEGELDDDITQMIFKVLANDGVEGGLGYIDFILTQANHAIEEKVQVSENLSDNYTSFFFGHKPPMFQYAGVLMNTYQDDWVMRMLRLFSDLGRGTQLARRGLLMHLRYDSMIVSGSMINFQWAHTGARETADDFSFGFLVKKLNIVYGGVSSVTAIENIASVSPQDRFFTPDGILLPEIESTQSYAQAPSSNNPEGISDATRSQPGVIRLPDTDITV